MQPDTLKSNPSWYERLIDHRFWPYALLAALVGIVYAQAVGFELVAYDDTIYVLYNDQVKEGLTWENVRWAFEGFHARFWHPLVWLSLMLDTDVFGYDPAGYHFTNILIHLANTILLFYALNRITGRRLASWLVAAFFALHPTHVESVAWVTERKDVLSAFFWVVTMICYARFAEKRTAMRYVTILVSMILGMMAKPMLVTLPFVFLLLDYWPYRRWSLDKGAVKKFGLLVAEKIPLFVITILFSGIAYLAQSQAKFATTQYTLGERVWHSIYSYWIYLKQTFWPVGLVSHYEMPESYPLSIMISAIIIVFGISGLAFYYMRSLPFFFVGWFWFAGTLVPVIGLVRVGTFAHADRFLYIPHIGLFIAIF
jgi:hypothetical protein